MTAHSNPECVSVGGWGHHPVTPPPSALSKVGKYVDLSVKYIYVNLHDTYVE